MKNLIAKALLPVAATLATMGGAGDAHAWLKFKNSTNTTVNIAHAYDSVNTAGCGFFDACESADAKEKYRVHYWWVLAPGAESTVLGDDYNNALNQFYAFDVDSKLFWNGGGTTFRITYKAGSHCGNVDHGLQVGDVDLTFRKLNTSRCCGLSCIGFSEPSDKRIELTL